MTPEKLKEVRGTLSQTELAEKLGVAQSRISEWERGVGKVPEYIVKLIDCLEESGRF